MLDLTSKNTAFSQSGTLQCGDKLLSLEQPVVMGILNITPDSFYDGGHITNVEAAVKRAGQMISEGASIIDIGAVSTRPGATYVPDNEETDRLLPVLKALTAAFAGTIISVDTYRASVAAAAVANGAGIVNDISGGELDNEMFKTMARLRAAYVLMHMKGTPANMQANPQYADVTAEVFEYLNNKVSILRNNGIENIIIDPGFGFGKTIEHNYRLLQNLDRFKELQAPILAGVSRKSMIYKLLNIDAHAALNGTSVVNTLALLKGAKILRVHDVKEAVQTIRIVKEYLLAGN